MGTLRNGGVVPTPRANPLQNSHPRKRRAETAVSTSLNCHTAHTGVQKHEPNLFKRVYSSLPTTRPTSTRAACRLRRVSPEMRKQKGFSEDEKTSSRARDAQQHWLARSMQPGTTTQQLPKEHADEHSNSQIRIVMLSVSWDTFCTHPAAWPVDPEMHNTASKHGQGVQGQPPSNCQKQQADEDHTSQILVVCYPSLGTFFA